MAGFAGMEEDKQTDSGYEKTYHDGNRLVHEEWNKSGNGEYTVILADRFVVVAKGNGVCGYRRAQGRRVERESGGTRSAAHARREARISKKARAVARRSRCVSKTDLLRVRI